MKTVVVTALFATLALPGCRNAEPEAADEVFVSGRIEGEEAQIAAQVPGRVVRAPVREGDRVAAGDELVVLQSQQVLARRDQAESMLTAARRQLERARIQVPVLEQRIRQLELRERQAETEASGRITQAQGQLASARANLARSESELAQARADAERLDRLAGKEAVPVQAAEQQRTRQRALEAVVEAAREQVAAAEGALEATRSAAGNAAIVAAEKAAAERQVDEARSVIRAAAAEVEAAEALVTQAQADVDELVIRAPFDGVVVTRAVEPGQVVAPGRPLATLVDPNSLYLRAFVPEARIDRVRVGQQAEVRLDAAPDQPLAAAVERIDPEAMFTPENTYFREDRVRQVVGVKLLLTEVGAAKLGMSAEGRILID